MPLKAAETFVNLAMDMARERQPKTPKEAAKLVETSGVNITDVRVIDDSHYEDTKAELIMHDGSRVMVVTETSRDRVWLAPEETPGRPWRKSDRYPPEDPRDWQLLEPRTRAASQTVECITRTVTRERTNRSAVDEMRYLYCLCEKCRDGYCASECLLCRTELPECQCPKAHGREETGPDCQHPNCSEEARAKLTEKLAKHARETWTREEAFPEPRQFREELGRSMQSRLQEQGNTRVPCLTGRVRETGYRQQEEMLRAAATHAVHQWLAPLLEEENMERIAMRVKLAKSWREVEEALEEIPKLGTSHAGMALATATDLSRHMTKYQRSGRRDRARMGQRIATEIAELGKETLDSQREKGREEPQLDEAYLELVRRVELAAG